MLSRDVMNECAQGWIVVTLPMLFVGAPYSLCFFFTTLTGPRLQKNETLPCIKACIRLIRFIFSSSVGHAEFQRQVVLPNIVKFSQGLIEILGKYGSEKLKVRVVFKVLCFSAR